MLSAAAFLTPQIVSPVNLQYSGNIFCAYVAGVTTLHIATRCSAVALRTLKEGSSDRLMISWITNCSQSSVPKISANLLNN
jgi:hypothetical protein